MAIPITPLEIADVGASSFVDLLTSKLPIVELCWYYSSFTKRYRPPFWLLKWGAFCIV